MAAEIHNFSHLDEPIKTQVSKFHKLFLLGGFPTIYFLHSWQCAIHFVLLGRYRTMHWMHFGLYKIRKIFTTRLFGMKMFYLMFYIFIAHQKWNISHSCYNSYEISTDSNTYFKRDPFEKTLFYGKTNTALGSNQTWVSSLLSVRLNNNLPKKWYGMVTGWVSMQLFYSNNQSWKVDSDGNR